LARATFAMSAPGTVAAWVPEEEQAAVRVSRAPAVSATAMRTARRRGAGAGAGAGGYTLWFMGDTSAAPAARRANPWRPGTFHLV
jgi:hypothetical protein